MEIKISDQSVKVQRAEEVAQLFRKIIETESEVDRDKEHFWVIGFKSNLNIKYIELVTLGTLEASLVHPREIFRTAILKAAGKILVAHNHPSGSTEPSIEDRQITYQLKEAGRIIGIKLLDHVILTDQGFYSFTEHGDL